MLFTGAIPFRRIFSVALGGSGWNEFLRDRSHI